MSVVTNVVLHIGILEEEDEKIKEVNSFFDKGVRPLIALDDESNHGWYGGTKYLECNLYVGAFNYFDLDGFLKHLSSVHWEAPENVQVFVKEDNDTRFKLIYGVSEYDDRFTERDMLLNEAQDWLEDLEKLLTDKYQLQMLREWQRKYKELYDIPKDTVEGSTSSIINETHQLTEG